MFQHGITRRIKGFRLGRAGKHELPRGARRPAGRLRVIGVITAIAMVTGAGGTAASMTLLAQPGATPREHPVQVGTTVNFGPATQKELRKLESTQQGRTALLHAFQDSFGQTARVAATSAQDSSGIHLDAACAPSFSCGISRTGGWHFWIIASYAAAQSANLVALQPYCIAALAPETAGLGAAACLTVGAVLWALVNNWPRFTNHGVWLEVYWWGIRDGRY